MSILPYKYSEQAILFNVFFQSLIAEKITTRWLKRLDHMRESKIIKKGHARVVNRKIVEIFHAESRVLKRFFQALGGVLIPAILSNFCPQLRSHRGSDLLDKRVQR